MDVAGLYPNIPHDFGLEAMRKALDKRDDKSISTQTLMDLAELVLKNNYFTHNETIFKQIRGTAMGTRFAPSYAIIAMAEFEEHALANYHLNPSVWWRYIDDIFLIWQHGGQNLKSFLDYLNSIHPTLKLTSSSSETEIECLDVLVINQNGQIETDLFVKKTDTHQYLHSSSCHRYHTKTGIPYGQALRLRRIISNDDKFEARCTDLKNWLTKRGFEEKMVASQIEKAKIKDRVELLEQQKAISTFDGPILALRYHPLLSSNVHGIIKNLHIILESTEELKGVFKELPRVTYRRAKNLKDNLVRATLPTPFDENQEAGSKGCKHQRCLTCLNVQTTDKFVNSCGSRDFRIRKGPHNCNTANVVYLLRCKTCGIQYVGSSKPPFRQRFNNYATQHRNYRKRQKLGTLSKGKSVPQQSLHKHFAQSDHNGIPDMIFTLIDSGTDHKDARKRESY